jgi:hypothetical protein
MSARHNETASVSRTRAKHAIVEDTSGVNLLHVCHLTTMTARLHCLSTKSSTKIVQDAFDLDDDNARASRTHAQKRCCNVDIDNIIENFLYCNVDIDSILEDACVSQPHAKEASRGCTCWLLRAR